MKYMMAKRCVFLYKYHYPYPLIIYTRHLPVTYPSPRVLIDFMFISMFSDG